MNEYIKILLTGAVTGFFVFVGYYFASYLESKRDLDNKKREIKTTYLIEAYRSIEMGMARGELLDEPTINKMEHAIGDIQLFGSEEEIRCAKEFTMSVNRTSYGDARELLLILGRNLRKEINLANVYTKPEEIVHWRLRPKK